MHATEAYDENTSEKCSVKSISNLSYFDFVLKDTNKKQVVIKNIILKLHHRANNTKSITYHRCIRWESSEKCSVISIVFLFKAGTQFSF